MKIIETMIMIGFICGLFLTKNTTIWMLFINCFLWSLGYLSLEDITCGLINEGLLSLMIAIVITIGFNKTFFIENWVLCLLRRIKSPFYGLIVFLSSVCIVSAFLSNTIVFIIFLPFIKLYCQIYNLNLSKYAIPLSYTTILGGVLTMIGTTNSLVLNSLLADKIGFLEITKYSLPCAIIGLIFIICTFYYYPEISYTELKPLYTVKLTNLEGISTRNEFYQTRFLKSPPNHANYELLQNQTVFVEIDYDTMVFQLKIMEARTGYLYVAHEGCPETCEMMGNTPTGSIMYLSSVKKQDQLLLEVLTQLSSVQKVAAVASLVLLLIGLVINQSILFGFYAILLNVIFAVQDYPQVLDSLNLNLYFIIAFSYPIGIFVEKTFLAQYLVCWLNHSTRLECITLVVVFSSIFSELITNPCSAIIMFFIVRNISTLSIKTAVLAILLGTNACFCLPTTYPTHVLVRQVVNYKVTDFVKFGLLLDLLYGGVAIMMLYIFT
jgi:di/tricarboxylate transporter